MSGPSCADRGNPISAWFGTPPPGWKPGMTAPCIACRAGAGKPCVAAPPPTEPLTALSSRIRTLRDYAAKGGANTSPLTGEPAARRIALIQELAAAEAELGGRGRVA